MYRFYESEKKIYYEKMEKGLFETNFKLVNAMGKLQGMLELLYQYDKITTDIFLSENKEIMNKTDSYLLNLNLRGV